MDPQVLNGGAMPFPQVANHIADDPTPKDQAIYVPSVTPGFAKKVFAGTWPRTLPADITPRDLNFLDPTNDLLRISHVMSSAGQALNQSAPCIISQRDRTKTLLVADSGGYQVASGRLTIRGDGDRQRILGWLEQHADVAMTLDVPTGPVLSAPGMYRYATSADCLAATVEHLGYFQSHRTPGKVRFLNVLQGNDQTEADVWYDTVKDFEFEGWAFAGLLRKDFFQLCRRLIIMADEKMLEERDWIHVLGTNELDVAVLLTTVQRALNRNVNERLRISYDTSSPFRMLAFNQIYTLPNFSASGMTMGTASAPDAAKYFDCAIRWPWPSPIGDQMTMGDFCVPGSRRNSFYRDAVSDALAAHHNLGALCWGVSTANRMFDAESFTHDHNFAMPTGAAAEAIEAIFKEGTMSALNRYESTFARLPHTGNYNSGEDSRDIQDVF